MSASLTRARLLRQHHRHEEAVALVLQHLATEPEDPQAFIELALARVNIPGMMEQALRDSRTAVGLRPGQAYPLILQAEILTRLDRDEESLAVANQALAIDPEYISGWNVKSMAEGGLSRWPDAEASARKALELDPDDGDASNLLAHALRVQGRLEESDAENRRRLARDPDNAFAFATSGWSALQRGRVQEAENYFKEALRIDPNLKHAREGLKNAYRSRSGFYRVFLKWSLYLQRFTEQNRFGFMIGIYIGFKVLRVLFTAVNPVLGMALVVVYFTLIFGSWLATALANLVVMKDPMARLSLERDEKLESVVVGGGFVAGILLVIGGMIAAAPVALAAGAGLMLSAVPGSMVFTNRSLRGRIVFGISAVAVLLIGLTAAQAARGQSVPQAMDGKPMSTLFIAIFITVIVSWLSAIPALRQKKPA